MINLVLFYILVFILSCVLLALSGNWLVAALVRIAKFLKWKEFFAAFFIFSFAAELPELFIGVSSAIQGVPELSFGNIVGANVVHFSLAIALAIFLLTEIKVESRVVQTSCLFTVAVSIMPLLLILDKSLSRFDGLILILSFLLYLPWIFSEGERFTKIYDGGGEVKAISVIKKFKNFFKDLGILIAGTVLIILASQGVIQSSVFFAKSFNISLSFIGIVLLGLGTALPEVYFSITAAKKDQAWMILGNLMGCAAISASLILGLVALIKPVQIVDFSPFAVGRAFLFLAAIFFLIFLRTDKKLTKNEGIVLFLIYIAFIFAEFLIF